MSYGKSITHTVLCVLIALVMSGAAIGQVTPPEDEAQIASLSNPYLTVSLGYGGTATGVDQPVSGRWAVVTREGNPETTQDNNKPLIEGGIPYGDNGYWKIKVGEVVRTLGDTSTGSWTKPPQAVPVPTPGLGLGKTGGYIVGEWTTTISAGVDVVVGVRISLVRDQARFELVVKNSSRIPQRVGLAMNGNVQVGGTSSVGRPFVPGVGVVQSPQFPDRAYGMLLSGTAVPTYFEVFDDVSNPVIACRNTLNQQDCTKPDFVAIGDYADLSGYGFWPTTYTPDPTKPINNLDWTLCWDQKALAAGASRKIVTYFGMAAASGRWTSGKSFISDSAALSVSGPPSLAYDSTTIGQNDLSPFPFTVKAYVYNLATDPGPYKLNDVTATLFLPAGLRLANGSQARQDIGEVDINSESIPVSWEVEPTGEFCGELEYYVSVSDRYWQQTVARKIMLPATKKSVFYYGWQLMHVPFTFNNFQIDDVFGLNLGTFGARYYEGPTGRYKPVQQVKLGQGFWMYVGGMTFGTTQPLRLASDAAIAGESLGKQVEEQYIDLTTGYNIIGNPLVYPVYWGQVQVYNRAANATVSLDQAVANSWISKTIFTWSPQKWLYENYKDNSTLLSPWRGYWVYAKQPVTLIFRPPTFPQSNVTAENGGY